MKGGSGDERGSGSALRAWNSMPVCISSTHRSTTVVDNRHFGEEQLILHLDSYLDFQIWLADDDC